MGRGTPFRNRKTHFQENRVEIMNYALEGVKRHLNEKHKDVRYIVSGCAEGTFYINFPDLKDAESIRIGENRHAYTWDLDFYANDPDHGHGHPDIDYAAIDKMLAGTRPFTKEELEDQAREEALSAKKRAECADFNLVGNVTDFLQEKGIFYEIENRHLNIFNHNNIKDINFFAPQYGREKNSLHIYKKDEKIILSYDKEQSLSDIAQANRQGAVRAAIFGHEISISPANFRRALGAVFFVRKSVRLSDTKFYWHTRREEHEVEKTRFIRKLEELMEFLAAKGASPLLIDDDKIYDKKATPFGIFSVIIKITLFGESYEVRARNFRDCVGKGNIKGAFTSSRGWGQPYSNYFYSEISEMREIVEDYIKYKQNLEKRRRHLAFFGKDQSYIKRKVVDNYKFEYVY